jgi:hypothetical protein
MKRRSPADEYRRHRVRLESAVARGKMQKAVVLHGHCRSVIYGADEAEILRIRKLILDLRHNQRISRSESRDPYLDARS